MRRGLISWAKTELPEAVFAMRVAQAQAAMATDGLDAFVTYINITRPAAASWFTGFVPYWSEGLMVLPRSGKPYLIVALSKRVQGWIEITASVETVVSTPNFGLEAGKRIAAEKPAARVGVLELDTMPSGTMDALASGGATLVDATALYRRLRDAADPAEIALTTRAAEIARDALATLDANVGDAHAAIATVERAARLAGAEDVFVALAPVLDRATAFRRAPFADTRLGDAFAIRLTLAYKGHWMRLVRTYARAPERVAGIALADARFADAIARLPDTAALAAFEAWLVEGTTRSQPLEALAGSSVAGSGIALDGKVVSVTAIVTIDGRHYATGGPAVVGSAWRPSALLVAPHA
jgi:hypothetical protein